ncbi:hypothetical protein FK268_01405 [Tsukamurella sputi]|uniref:Uncharacterized protein n=1 Tax=Tsukamurella sputi TaxID=2591848 RepID=A0A5C5RSE3_9ACTN|nr:hypothetical protein [Tsukamurella sputi]TWS25939.1 hypothetical protein FK268_01405 [Tsukamurella sputi]
MTDKKMSGSPWPVVVVFAVVAVFILGLNAWGAGREAGFGLLVLAGCVLIGCERIAVAIRQRDRD